MTDPRRVFVGRADEAQAFSRVADRYAKALAAGTLDYEPRTNVLVFHGPGGMGKSRLLLRLRAWTDRDETPEGWPADPLPGRPRRGTARYDLADGLDIDVLLHRLRAAAADAGVRTRAFDVGLLARWSLMRPLEKLPDLDPRRHEALWTLVESGAKTALKPLDVVPGVSGLTVETVKRWILKLRAERRREGTIAACPALADALEELVDEDNAFGAAALGAVLDWDLDREERAPEQLRPCMVVFLDTFERVRSDTRFQERALNRMVHQTPRVLWVIAGRRRLDWADGPRGVYDCEGADEWPGLARSAADPDQIELPGLAAEQVEQLVRRTLADGAPAELPVAAIQSAAEGYPLKLALVIERARKRLRRREPVDEQSLGGPYPGILRLVADDLDADGRNALNAGSLVRAFDVPLLEVGAPLEPGRGKGERFVVESLVDASDNPHLPHTIHAAVRREVRLAPVEVDGAWSADGWTAAGTHMLDALRARLKQEEQDPEARLALIGAAFDISAELATPVTWLLDAAVAHGNKERLIATIEGRIPAEVRAPWSAAFEAFVTAWEPHDSATRAERFAAVAALPGAGRAIPRYARRQRAYELRTLGRHAEAEEIFADLRRTPPGDTPLLMYQHALTYIHLGRLRDAEALRVQLIGLSDPDGRVASFVGRLHGEIRLQHGDLRAAADAAAARAHYFETTRRNEFNAKELRTAEARRRALLGDPEALVRADEMIEWTGANNAPQLLRSALCSKAIYYAGRDEAGPLIERSLAISGAPGADGIGYHEATALVFDAAVRRCADTMRAVRARIAGSPGERDTRWCRPLAWWQALTIGEPAPRYGDAVQWIAPDDEDTVIGRWNGVVAERADRLSSAHAADD